MTDRERAVMAFMVPDPDAWLAHAAATFGEERAAEFLAAKVARWSDAYDTSAEQLGYKTRAERDADEESDLKASFEASLATARQVDQNKQEEFNAAVDARVRAIIQEMKVG